MLLSMELSTGVISWELRGIGVSVMMGFGSGDLSMGFSSSLSWWIQRSGGLTSLEFPLYLWEPFTDLQAARFLGTKITGFLKSNCFKYTCQKVWQIKTVLKDASRKGRTKNKKNRGKKFTSGKSKGTSSLSTYIHIYGQGYTWILPCDFVFISRAQTGFLNQITSKAEHPPVPRERTTFSGNRTVEWRWYWWLIKEEEQPFTLYFYIFLKLNLGGKHWLITLQKFQVGISVIQRQHIVAHHPELSSSIATYLAPLSLSSLPCPCALLVTSTVLYLWVYFLWTF